MLGETRERELPVAAFEDGERKAEEHVAGAIEGFAAAGIERGPRGVGRVSRTFAQACGLSGDDKWPVDAMRKPIGKPFTMAANQREGGSGVAVGSEQGLLEEAAESGAAFLGDQGLGLLAQAGEAGTAGIRPVARRGRCGRGEGGT